MPELLFWQLKVLYGLQNATYAIQYHQVTVASGKWPQLDAMVCQQPLAPVNQCREGDRGEWNGAGRGTGRKQVGRGWIEAGMVLAATVPPIPLPSLNLSA